jgi:hypothetical protein
VNVCSATDDAVGKLPIIRLVLWDNNKVDLFASFNGKIVDSGSGAVLGNFEGSAKLAQMPSTLPFVTQLNINVACEGTGQVVNLHLGLTVDENGNAHVH